MKSLLFLAEGRIGRGQFWKANILLMLAILIVGLAANMAIAQLIPNQAIAAGDYSVSGAAALPFILVNLALFIVPVWAGICLGIKRYHDRNKPGIWLLILFVPFIGGLWYFIETGFLRGTAGPNQFGPDPVSHDGVPAQIAYSAA
jgi:uncharacterized membrane protein YhaH (DUF805 family)